MRNQRMTAERARNLWNRISDGQEDARNMLITDFQPVIENVARKHARAGIQAEELMADGNIALDKAIKAYDPKVAKCNFMAYAVTAIDNEIKGSDLLFTGVRVPAYFKSFIRFYKRTVSDLTNIHQRSPTREEILNHMILLDNSSKTDQKKYEYYKKRIIDYETMPVLMDDPMEVSHMAEDDLQITQLEQRIQVEQLIKLLRDGKKIEYTDLEQSDHHALVIAIAEEFLNSDQRIVLYHSYGFNGYDKLKAEEIRYKLDYPVTIQTISKKKRQALKKIKSFFV